MKEVDFKKQGYKFYKPLKIWVNSKFGCYCSNRKKQIYKDAKNCVLVKSKRYNILKIGLFLFKDEKIRAGHLRVIDEAKELSVNNICYANIEKVEPVKYDDLIRCIKKQFKEVNYRIGANSIIFKCYISKLAERIEFDKNSTEYKMFNHYLNNPISKQNASLLFKFSVITGLNIINNYLKQILEFYKIKAV